MSPWLNKLFDNGYNYTAVAQSLWSLIFDGIIINSHFIVQSDTEGLRSKIK